MAGVDRFVAETSSRKDRANRSAKAFQGANLVGGSMRAQNQLVLEPEGVLHIARGVVVRDIQRFEAEIFRLDFRAVENGEAHPLEDIFKFHLRQRNRMKSAKASPFSWSGQIKIVRLATRGAL